MSRLITLFFISPLYTLDIRLEFKIIIIKLPTTILPLVLNESSLSRIDCIQYFGVILDIRWTWSHLII